jgi:hypothetical protein
MVFIQNHNRAQATERHASIESDFYENVFRHARENPSPDVEKQILFGGASLAIPLSL